MPWLQCSGYPNDRAVFREAFEQLYSEQGAPPDMALFVRTSIDTNLEIYLVSPAAAVHAGTLAGDWGPAEDIGDYGWALFVGPEDAWERFDLRSTHSVAGAAPSPG